MPVHVRLTAFMLCALAVLGACSRQGSATASPVHSDEPSQVIARVNGEEITIYQLNAEAATVPMIAGENPDEVRKEVLRAIVYRTLLRQAAVKDKLDHNPNIRMLIDGAKDRVLAETYINSQTGTTPPPTSDQIEKYITDNPLQFKERRIYTFQCLTLDAKHFSKAMVPFFDQKDTFDSLRNYLDGKGIGYQLADVRLPSTDFPKQVQDQLAGFNVGDNVVVRGQGGIQILKIKSWVDMPVSDSEAQQAAANTLHDQAVEQRDEALRDQLLTHSHIEFIGDFAATSLDEPLVQSAAAASGNSASASDTASLAPGRPGVDENQEGVQ
jgi:EpsD family peptidyl-prolyl cis-trans isomerase